MAAAARITDLHICPLSTGPVPHVGGAILGPGASNVMIGGLPAARVGDVCICAAGPPNMIAMGSSTVLINGMGAARMGDLTAHAGAIASGLGTVIIGG